MQMPDRDSACSFEPCLVSITFQCVGHRHLLALVFTDILSGESCLLGVRLAGSGLVLIVVHYAPQTGLNSVVACERSLPATFPREPEVPSGCGVGQVSYKIRFTILVLRLFHGIYRYEPSVTLEVCLFSWI
jgi:hypothetical protein